MNWETLLCIGDSITLGSRSYLGYPEYCAQYLHEQTKKDWNVSNVAIAGYTTVDILRLVDLRWSELKLLKPEIISILAGTNDLKIATSQSDFQIAYSQLVLKSRLLIGNANIILIRIPHLHDGVMLPYHINMNDRIVEYNQAIDLIAKQHGLLVMQMEQSPDHFFDGIHLNGEGSLDWGRQLGDFIMNLRRA